ncbi:MAG: ATP-binding cassette domain-containing protein [Flavobacterium sp.]|nr:ATP-binding cassette domain-containing protein [Flavobacterium sp.]
MLAKLEQLSKVYFTSAGTFNTKENTSITLNKSEIIVITGESTDTKKAVLTLMGCLIHPTDGILEINGKKCISSNLIDIALVKLQSISFIFQKNNLLGHLNAEENVSFPLRIQKSEIREMKRKTMEALKKVNMFQYRKKMPGQLSLFQQQQIVIAKALIINPSIIICDNPTAYLEDKDGIEIMKLLKELANEGKSIAILNHDKRFYGFIDRAFELKNEIVTELTLF